MSEPILYTEAEVAQLLRVHYNTVRNMIKRGDLKPVRTGNTIRISANEVQRLLGETK